MYSVCYYLKHTSDKFLHSVLFSHQEYLLLGLWGELPEVNVQRSQVTAECENVTEVLSSPPGNRCSHCCDCSRWVPQKG